MELRLAIVELARRLAAVVRPQIGSSNAAEVVGEAQSGDYTFKIDEVAESALERLVREISEESGIAFCFYSEDRGLVNTAGGSDGYVLIIDPIDGTRPAMCGLESCCVSIAAAPFSQSPTFADLEAGCLLELKSGAILAADRTGGVEIGSFSGTELRPLGSRLSDKESVRHLFWAHEVCARPSEATHALLGKLINESSFGGGVFVFNSSSYAISRVITGQLDAYLDPYASLLTGDSSGYWLKRSRELFGGKVFGLFAYDIAASVFLAKRAGAFVCDAMGKPLDTIPLIPGKGDLPLSCVVAANRAMGELLLSFLAEGSLRADSISVK
jgi:myo-inositol-1(or 4)-monophosphatase